jgi:hypothetical protein
VNGQRDAEPIAGGRGNELRADRGAAHREDDDRVHVCVPVRQLHGAGDAARLRQLTRKPRHAAEHVLGVDALERRRIVEGDRVLEQRRRVAVGRVLGLGAGGLVVGVLVAEEVAGIHQRTAAAGRSAPAMRLPSARSVSTSSGDRAST